MNSIYESEAFAALPDKSLHPGGLRLTGRAVRLAGLEAGMAAVDIGCGTGATAAYLTEAHRLRVTGLETSDALLEAGRGLHPGLALLSWDGGALPFPEGSLDAALLECVLSLLGDAGAVLAECARVLAYSGVLIVSDVVSKKEHRPPGGPMSVSALTEQLARAGFDVVMQEDHTPALRTYAAALYEKTGGGLGACAFFGGRTGAPPRLSELGYALVLARKNQDR